MPIRRILRAIEDRLAIGEDEADIDEGLPLEPPKDGEYVATKLVVHEPTGPVSDVVEADISDLPDTTTTPVRPVISTSTTAADLPSVVARREAKPTTRDVMGPYRPDAIADAWSGEWFALRAASIRGDAHRSRGTPRQDDFAAALVPGADAVVIAVADGVSAAVRSHLGATTAARVAVDEASRQLRAGQAVEWNDLVNRVAWSVLEVSSREGSPGPPDRRGLEYATTLCVAIVERSASHTMLEAVAVGDTSCLVASSGGVKRLVGGPSSDRNAALFVNETEALPRVPHHLRAVRCELRTGRVVLIATDGIFGLDAESHLDVMRRLRRLAAPARPDMLTFAQLVEGGFATDADDDRTMVAIWIKSPDER